MLEFLKEKVCAANLLLPQNGLVTFTWGNVSEIDRASGLVVIKPSGIPYKDLTPEKMVVINLEGKVIEGHLKPSSDAPTHLELYRRLDDCQAVVHIHARWSTSWAQAGRSIPIYGTTHADYFFGDIPCTRELTNTEIQTNYEQNTGKVIVECLEGLALDNQVLNVAAVPAVIVHGHGPFIWGKDAFDAVNNAVVLEEVAMMAVQTEIINHGPHAPLSIDLQRKHYLRKHGKDAYYGQN